MRFFLIMLLTCVSAGAQDAPPELLVDAGQCLGAAKQDWLDLAHHKGATVELGSEDLSRPPDQRAQVPPDSETRRAGAAHREQMLYLVDYTPYDSKGTLFPHSEGTVFSFVVGGDKHHRVLRLLFPTRFRQVFGPDNTSSRIELVDPPYGGIGTHDEIISAIRQSKFQSTFSIPVTQLRNPPPRSVRCEMENQLP